MSPAKIGCGLLVVAVMAVLSGAAIGAQNLDQGKSAQKLFAEGCASCRSPRGLAKGRFQLTLYLFLQKHYSSGSSSAWAGLLSRIHRQRQATWGKAGGEIHRSDVVSPAGAGAVALRSRGDPDLAISARLPGKRLPVVP
jgi:hypothetical protein